MAPHPFNDEDFVTLRYRWHTERGAFNGNKYPKTLIDVTRVSEEDIGIKAPSIHNPIEKYCIPDPPHYSLSLFRVNHYLDSAEAFYYRTDARIDMRECEEVMPQK